MSDSYIEIYKISKLIKSLSNCKGKGTSMISLIIPPKGQINLIQQMLTNEYGTASNIKSRVNRLSVLSAITSTQNRLKLYNKIPPNGLIIYCGTILTEDNKEKHVTIDFEPFKPINASLYLCDNKFHTEALEELLKNDNQYGYVIIDGNGCLFGTLSGNDRKVLYKFEVDLPSKHGRGGQSALRFARLREISRHNYVTKCVESAKQLFISDNRVNVEGIILAGNADFKNDFQKSKNLDPRILSKIMKVIDVSYGGENGFNQAIELSTDLLKDSKLLHEKNMISKFFDKLTKSDEKCLYGIKNINYALEVETGSIETLIIWENIELMRYHLKNPKTDEETIEYFFPNEEQNSNNFLDKKTKEKLEIINKMEFLDWIIEKHKDLNVNIEIISDNSPEGSQFCRGFGGIGCLLRYPIQFNHEEYNDESDNDDLENDDKNDDEEDLSQYF